MNLPKGFPHKYQKQALKSKKRFILMLTGVRGGKTLTGAVWLGNQFAKYPHDNHAIIAPTYKILEQATMPTFFEVFPEYKKYYREKASKIQIPGYGNIFIRSADRETSLEGMTLRSCWVDEAGDISRYAWIIIQARTGTSLGQVFLTTRAYGINWLKKDFHELWEEGNEYYDVIQFETKENPGFAKVEWDRVRKSLDPRTFGMMYKGLFSEMIGKIYQQFNERKHVKSTVPYNDFIMVLGGIDWGFTEPAAMVAVGITKDWTAYVIDEYYSPGKTLEQLGEKAKEWMAKYRVQAYFSDPSEPMNIYTFRQMGIPMNDANNKVIYGIDRVRKLLGNGKLYLKDSCQNLIDEFQTYQYEEDRKDITLKESPLKKNDHGLDALRYVIATQEQGDTSVIAGVSSESTQISRDRIHISEFINEEKPGHWLSK